MNWGPEIGSLSRAMGGTLPTPDALMIEVLEQRQIIDKKSEVIDAQQKRIALLEERIRLLQTQKYGRSSEQSDDQLDLFEPQSPPPSLPPVSDKAARAKGKKRQGRKGFSPEIPRAPIYLHLSDAEKAGAVDTFFVKTKEELDITPAKVQVLEYVLRLTLKASCLRQTAFRLRLHWQEKAVFVEHGQRHLVEVQRPRHVLGKAAVSVAFLAYLIVAKYCDVLPLYRLSLAHDLESSL